ncbi:hypothetical protein LDJ94_01340 [Fusobacterium nucleatum]|uniref:hypothetical protein n=2 Tax=Fusobacterium nucleatum TaxID=851 RepID=UPI0030D3C11B
MAFLDKIAKQERTGAGIAGVNVDTGIVNMISPKNFDGTPIKAIGTMSTYQLEVLDTIEKFAKDVDKARTENAKIKLGLDLENARLALEEKWSGVHDKYTNDDTWNSYLEDKKKLLSEQSKLISSMKYMSMEEKKLTLEKNDIAYREDYAKHLGKRTDAVAKREADNAIGNLEQMIAITSNLDIHDDKKAQENYKTMINQINILKEFAGLSNEQALVMYGNYVAKSEMGRQENYLEQVVMNEDLTFEQREAKLNELKKVMDNKDLMRAYAKEMADLFTTDNKEEAEEYLYTKLTDESSKVINRISNQFKRVKKERQEAERARIKAEKAEQAFYRKQLKSSIKEKDRQVEKAMNNKDPYAFLKYKYGIDVSYQELSDRDDLIDKITGRTGISYADKDNNMAFRFVPPEINTLDEFNDYMAENQFTGAERDKRVKSFAASSKIPLAVIDKGMSDPKYKEIYEEGIYANSMRKKSKISISDIKKDGLFKNWGDHNDNIDGLVDYYKSLSYSQVEAEEKAVEFMISKNLPELVNTKNSNEKIEILYDFADNFDISDYKDDLTVIKEIKNSKPQRFVNFKDEKRERNKKTNSKTTSRPNHK